MSSIENASKLNSQSATVPRLGLFNRRAKLAAYQNQLNTQYLDKQNEYNSPVNQMARFAEAGLNPNLVYSQGNAGNQSSTQTAQDYEPAPILGNILNVMGFLQQSAMQSTQRQAIEANTVKTTNQAALAEMQARVLAKNPLLDEAGFNAIIDGLKATAESKAANAAVDKTKSRWFNTRLHGKLTPSLLEESGDGAPTGWRKMDMEFGMLIKRFDLANADQSIKAKVLQSKEFQNAILEVQKKFMTDADITPQHIVQFIQLLLMKIL